MAYGFDPVRNLHERCEVVFPVCDGYAMRRLRDEILEAYLRDDVKARMLQSDGTYIRAANAANGSRRKASGLSAQDFFMKISANPELRLGSQPAAVAPTDKVEHEEPATADEALTEAALGS